jgi:hypothetical protein
MPDVLAMWDQIGYAIVWLIAFIMFVPVVYLALFWSYRVVTGREPQAVVAIGIIAAGLAAWAVSVSGGAAFLAALGFYGAVYLWAATTAAWHGEPNELIAVVFTAVYVLVAILIGWLLE